MLVESIKGLFSLLRFPFSSSRGQNSWQELVWGKVSALTFSLPDTTIIDSSLPNDHKASGSLQQPKPHSAKSWTHYPKRLSLTILLHRSPRISSNREAALPRGLRGFVISLQEKSNVDSQPPKPSQHAILSLLRSRCWSSHTYISTTTITFFLPLPPLNYTKGNLPEQLSHGHPTVLQNGHYQFC